MRDEAVRIVNVGTPGAWNLGGWCVAAKALDLYDRIQELSQQFACPLSCAEVGVYEGKSLFVQAVALRDSPHGGFITGIDPYTVEANIEGFDISDPNQKKHVDWWSDKDPKCCANLKGALKRCQREIAARELEEWCELIVSTPDHFSFRPQHWIHLDDAHSPTSSLRNAQLLVPFLLPGGLLCVDDVHWPTMQPAREWIKSQLTLVSENVADGMQWEFYRR